MTPGSLRARATSVTPLRMSLRGAFLDVDGVILDPAQLGIAAIVRSIRDLAAALDALDAPRT